MRYIITAQPKTSNSTVKTLRARTTYLVATLRLWRGLYGNLERISITREHKK